MAETPIESLESLYERHAPAVWAYARWRAPRRDLAEDLAAEAFLSLARRLREKGTPEDPLGYLLAGVRSRAIDELRRRRTSPLPSDEIPHSYASPVEESERREKIWAAVRSMDEPLAEAVVLRFLADLTFEEAARLSGVPRSTLESRYVLALEKLAFLLRDEKP